MREDETKHVRFFKEKLKPGEEIKIFLEGYIGEIMGKGKETQHNGNLIITNERVIFYRKGILGEVLETIPVYKITSVEHISLMGHRVLTIHTSHDSLKFKTFEDKVLFEKAYNILESQRETPPSDSQKNDPLDQIKKLSELYEAGAISKEEFEEKKAKLLDQI